MKRSSLLITLILWAAVLQVQASDYKYIRIGKDSDAITKVMSGYALMGGGSDLDEAFRFL
jgi:hypothetical protein